LDANDPEPAKLFLSRFDEWYAHRDAERLGRDAEDALAQLLPLVQKMKDALSQRDAQDLQVEEKQQEYSVNDDLNFLLGRIKVKGVPVTTRQLTQMLDKKYKSDMVADVLSGERVASESFKTKVRALAEAELAKSQSFDETGPGVLTPSQEFPESNVGRDYRMSPRLEAEFLEAEASAEAGPQLSIQDQIKRLMELMGTKDTKRASGRLRGYMASGDIVGKHYRSPGKIPSPKFQKALSDALAEEEAKLESAGQRRSSRLEAKRGKR
jgi:hypothetical protein